MRDFYKELRDKKVIDAEFIEFLDLGKIDLSENDKKSIIEKIKIREYTFAKDLSKELKERFYDKMPPINKYLELLTAEGAYKTQAERLLGGEDFNMEEFKEFYEACKLRGYGLKFKKGNSQNNLMQLATFYGRFEVYEFLKEQGMQPLDYITADDFTVDGQAYFKCEESNGVKIFIPFNGDIKNITEETEEDKKQFIQERIAGIEAILRDIITTYKNEPKKINERYIQNFAAYFGLIGVLDELYKIPEIEINPSSERARDTSPVQIYMTHPAREIWINDFIELLKNQTKEVRFSQRDFARSITCLPNELEFLSRKFKAQPNENFLELFDRLVAFSCEDKFLERFNLIKTIISSYPQVLSSAKFFLYDNQFDENLIKFWDICKSSYLEHHEKISSSAADQFIDIIFQELDKLDETKKAQLLKAAIFHGRADIVDKLIFEHGIYPDKLVTDKNPEIPWKQKILNLSQACQNEGSKQRITSLLKKHNSKAQMNLQLLLNKLNVSNDNILEIENGLEKLKEKLNENPEILKMLSSSDYQDFIGEKKYQHQYIALKLLVEKFAEYYADISPENAETLLNFAMSEISAFDQDVKTQLLKAAIFHGRADIVDKLIFEHGVKPDGLENNYTVEDGQKEINSVMPKDKGIDHEEHHEASLQNPTHKPSSAKMIDVLLSNYIDNIDDLGQETKNGILKAAIFYGRKDIVEKLIFEHGVNPDDLVVDSDESKSLKTKVIELSNDCRDEDKRRTVKHCLRKYKKIEEKAFKLVTQDLEASYLPSAENDPAKPEVAPAEVIKAIFKIEDAQIQNAGFGLKVKAFIKFMTSKLNWNDAKVSAYYEEKIVPELKAEFEKKPVKDLESRSEAAKYLREQVEAKKSKVIESIRR